MEESTKKYARVSKKFLEDLAGEPLSYDYIIKNKERLDTQFEHIIKMYGFNSMYELYLYADSNDSELLVKGGQKDLSKLKPVKRKVVRNGKVMTTTIYEDNSSGSDKGNELDSKRKETKVKTPILAVDLEKESYGEDEEELNPKKIAKLQAQTKSLGSGFSTSCSSYLLLNENGETRGAIGFTVKGKYLELTFSIADSKVSGLQYLAFSQLLLRAWNSNLGARVAETKDEALLAMYNMYGLTKGNGYYSVSSSTLNSILGEK
nr:MAG TPA: hypothetical protein [Herelleviridae sp.]